MNVKKEARGLPEFCKLSVSLAAKLAAIVVHADELLSPHGHHFDKAAIQTVLDDAEVKEWLNKCGPLAPVKRSQP